MATLKISKVDEGRKQSWRLQGISLGALAETQQQELINKQETADLFQKLE